MSEPIEKSFCTDEQLGLSWTDLEMWQVPIISSAYFPGPLFVPAAVVLPPFLVVTLRFDGLGERFVPAEVVDPDFFLAASMNALFALMISSSQVYRPMSNHQAEIWKRHKWRHDLNFRKLWPPQPRDLSRRCYWSGLLLSNNWPSWKVSAKRPGDCR